MPEYDKVQPGDPFKPSASLHNDTVDLVQQDKKSGVKKQPDKNTDTQSNKVDAYNASGEKAPWRGICEISDTSGTDAQVEFVKPGASDGVGQYGILLEPIKDGEMGSIAIAGGPWEVDVSSISVSVGDTIGHKDGQWTSDLGTDFNVIRNPTEGVVDCFFRKKGDRIVPKDSNIKQVVTTGSPDTSGQGLYEKWEGTANSYTKTEDWWFLWKYDNSIIKPAGVYMFTHISLGNAEFGLNGTPIDKFDPSLMEETCELELRFFTEDFNFDTLTKTDMENLDYIGPDPTALDMGIDWPEDIKEGELAKLDTSPQINLGHDGVSLRPENSPTLIYGGSIFLRGVDSGYIYGKGSDAWVGAGASNYDPKEDAYAKPSITFLNITEK